MPNERGEPKLRLDHLAVWVEDIDKTATFLTETVGWKRHPMEVDVSAEDETTGGMKAVFVHGGGLWLELVLPTSPGPGMDILEEVGEGAIVEVNFEAIDADYQKVLEEMDAKGIQMLSMDGSPLKDGGRIQESVRGDAATAETGQLIAYWPADISCGTTIEVYERRLDDATNLLNIRDEAWVNEKPRPNSPRIDRVCILVEDLSRTAEFYTEVMGLKRHPAEFSLDGGANNLGDMQCAFIEANGVWVQLVQPTSAGYVRDLLKEKGDGYAMEVAAEVDDLDAFYDHMAAKGITMVNCDGSPLAPGAKGLTVEPSGDRHHYFPLNESQGMRIMVYERGPRHTSMLHRRDDIWARVS